MNAPAAERIDWSQLWYPGPRRVFTESELARAGHARPSRTLLVMAAISAAVVAEAVLQHAPAAEIPRLVALLLASVFGIHRVAMALWWRPSRRGLFWAMLVSQAVFAAFALGVRWRVADVAARDWLCYTAAAIATVAAVVFWFVVVYRSQQIDARLRELDERARAVEMARQLATAQIQPHFLFNSLASLQHWVDTRDERAAPMLASLTAYLRATLPLFERRSLTLGEELEAARRYLEVMQARLGARLRFDVACDAGVESTEVPPGVILTLVENAVEHGVQPRLAGGRVRLSAGRDDSGAVLVEVADDGPGPPPDFTDAVAGCVGLTNTRARLAQAFGERARLHLSNAPEGGCIARLSLPSPPDIRTAPP